MTRAERIFVRISVIQTILAVTGFFVALVALFAALNEADAVRKQQMASVWPHVTIRDYNYGSAGAERFNVVIGNRGIGPARIMVASLLLDDAIVGSWRELVAPFTEDNVSEAAISTVRISGAVLAPGEDIVAFGVSAQQTSPTLVTAVQSLAQSGRVNIEICYCSVFDDCFSLNAVKETTTPVQKCVSASRNASV